MLKLGKPRSAKGLATFCARVADDKLAQDVVMLNLTKLEMSPADYFVICTCDSESQVHALSDHLKRQCKEVGILKPRSEGLDAKEWIIMDFFDVIVHIMMKDKRHFYKLEKLWGDAQFLQLNEEGEARVMKKDEVKNLINDNSTEENV